MSQQVALERLRDPFPADQVEKLPKPTFKNAWEGKQRRGCKECGGYHVLENTIHLDYVGHAGVTRRLLEADPMWSWEPLSFTEQGLPRFDQFGGLWIKLTVCGMTRLGYGDATGKAASSTAVKEIIGDAIRNAAMRFGVALDLWSKIDRHENKNPTETSRGQNAGRKQGNRQGGAGNVKGEDGQPANPPQRDPQVQEALDSLGSVCDEHGYSLNYAVERWEKEHPGVHITTGKPDEILALAVKLIEEATAEPDSVAGEGASGTAELGESPGPHTGDTGGRATEVVPGEQGEGSGDPWAAPESAGGDDGPLF